MFFARSGQSDVSGCDEEGTDADAHMDAQSALATILQQQTLINELQERLNKWEEGFSCHSVVENLLLLMHKHYQQMQATGRIDNAVALANRYYVEVPDNTTTHKTIVTIDKQEERLIESLWLNRIQKGTLRVLGQDCEVKVHPTLVLDDKPMPVLAFPSTSPYTPAILIPIRRQSNRWRHSFMCKNAPQYPGAVLDSQCATEWYNLGNFASAQDTILMPGSKLLEALVALWLRRAERDPPDATLLVDSKLVRAFVAKIVQNNRPRCHFFCLGQDKVNAYLVLTASDGLQSELARLPVGTANF